MFCERCGAEVLVGQRFCSSCGKPLGIVAMPAQGRVARHVRLLAILWLVASALRLMGGLAVFLVSGFVVGTVSHLGIGWPVDRLLPGILSAVGGFLLITAAAGFAAGWGLLEGETWARVLTIVLGFIALLHFPIGTALGVYTLWVLLPAESEQEYRRTARAA